MAGELSFQQFAAQQETRPLVSQEQYTGRYFVLFDEKEADYKAFTTLLHNKAGIRTASMQAFNTATFDQSQVGDAQAITYDPYRIALIGAEDDQMRLLRTLNLPGRLIPEKVVSLPEDQPASPSYYATEGETATWGLKAIGAHKSPYKGKGVKVCVLDTGFDLNHPQFKGRTVVSRSFVEGEKVQDKQGHGTHCIGIACGGEDTHGRRYGVASESEIYAFKVLSNRGSGAQSWILEGVAAAIEAGVHVISLSLGSDVPPGGTPDPLYNRIFSLPECPVASIASGNSSDLRRGYEAPVGAPANSSEVLAIGAIDVRSKMANFSCVSVNPGQSVALVAPGVDIYSSWYTPTQNRTISGTSMATPYVAGVLAQFIEKYPKATKAELKKMLLQHTKKLDLPTPHMGAGLVQSPL